MTEISYLYFNNIDSENRIRELVEGLRFLIPSWVRYISVARQNPNDENALLSISVDKPYRKAWINVTESFFQLQRDDMRRCLIHELLHIHHDDINVQVKGGMLPVIKKQNEDLHDELSNEYTSRMEGFIQDFSYVIDDLIARAEQGASPSKLTRTS